LTPAGGVRKTRARNARFVRRGGLFAVIAAAALLVSARLSSGSASITVSDPWVRANPAGVGSGTAYMTIKNTRSATDALVGASSPVAKMVEIHETIVMGSPAPSASDAMGGIAGMSPMPMDSSMPMASAMASMSGEMMGMQPVAHLEIPAGGTVQTAPGGYHVMPIGLTKDLNVGDTVQVTLKFEKGRRRHGGRPGPGELTLHTLWSTGEWLAVVERQTRATAMRGSQSGRQSPSGRVPAEQVTHRNPSSLGPRLARADRGDELGGRRAAEAGPGAPDRASGVGIGPTHDGIAAAPRQPFDPSSPVRHPRRHRMHRLEGVGATAGIAPGQGDEQALRSGQGGGQQRVGDDGKPTLLMDRSHRLRERQPGRHDRSQADPYEVPAPGRDLLADHELDRDPLVTGAGDERLGNVDAVVVGQNGHLQTARPERGIHGPRRPAAD
jgi:hypothetical protein